MKIIKESKPIKDYEFVFILSNITRIGVRFKAGRIYLDELCIHKWVDYFYGYNCQSYVLMRVHEGFTGDYQNAKRYTIIYLMKRGKGEDMKSDLFHGRYHI